MTEQTKIIQKYVNMGIHVPHVILRYVPKCACAKNGTFYFDRETQTGLSGLLRDYMQLCSHAESRDSLH